MARNLRIHSIRCTRTYQENCRHLGNLKLKNSNKLGKRGVKLISVNLSPINYTLTENLSKHNLMAPFLLSSLETKYVNFFRLAA